MKHKGKMQWTALETENGLINSLMAYRKDEPPSVGTVISEVQGILDSPPYLTIHLRDGTIRSGPVADFDEPSVEQFREYQESV